VAVATANYVHGGGSLQFFAGTNTIRRTVAATDWTTDGFQVGTKFMVSGTTSNDTIAKTGFYTVTAIADDLATNDLLTVAESLANEGPSAGSTFTISGAIAYQSTPDSTLWLFDSANISGVNLDTVTFAQLNIKFTATLSTSQTVDRRQTLVINGAAREISNTTYLGAVWIDTVNGSSGTAFPIGTPGAPVNNEADARLIATAIGVRTYKFYQAPGPGSTFILSQDHPEWIFDGLGSADNITINVNSNSVDNGNFINCRLTGTMVDGDFITMITGILEDVTNFQGICQQSGLAGNIFMPRTAQSGAIFALCTDLPGSQSGFPGLLTISMGGDGGNNGTLNRLWIRFFSGSFSVINCHSSGTCSIESISSTCRLDSTVLGNVITAGVFGQFIDGATNAAAKSYYHLNINAENPGTNTISAAVWNDVLSGHLTAGSTGEALNNAATAVGVADAVWDEPLASHETANTFGERVGKKLLDLGKFLGLK
jgi:hypothetical protein